MTTEAEILAASKEFYAALNRAINGNAATVKDIWSQSATATAMHPIGGREDGPDAIYQSFVKFAEISSDGQVQLDDQFIQVTDDMAYELGVENGQFSLAGQQVTVASRVTNIYRREAGAWRIVHHHSDVSPAMIAALA
jgi:ketosteroid isomerase-like protein